MTETRRALVTGANRGIGLACACQLAERGYEVWIGSRDARAGVRAAQRVDSATLAHARATPLRRAHVLALDVSDLASVQAAATQLERAGIALDVLVNNAGVSLDGFDADVVRRTLAVNLFGARDVSDVFDRLLRDGARLVMLSSGMGSLDVYGAAIRARFSAADITRSDIDVLVGEFETAVARGDHVVAGWPSSAYRVSKAALNALTRVIARERPHRRVNAVCPGWVRTDMGGAGAPRSVDEGARSVLSACELAADGPTGAIFRDGKPAPW